MSILRVLQLVCDGLGCQEAYSADYSDLDSAVTQRKKAARLGWRRSGGIDLCPTCVQRRASERDEAVERT